MKRLMIKAKTCLNNDCGGPNLENMIGIGASIAVFWAVQKFGRKVMKTISAVMKGATSELNG